MHVAFFSTPLLQEVTPCSMKLSSHVGVQVAPSAREDVHVPTPPFSGGNEASHVEEMQVPLLVPEQPEM